MHAIHLVALCHHLLHVRCHRCPWLHLTAHVCALCHHGLHVPARTHATRGSARWRGHRTSVRRSTLLGCTGNWQERYSSQKPGCRKFFQF